MKFDKALIATGANVNILRVEGAENEGSITCVPSATSDAIRADAEKADHVVLIGGSYIGCEVAASLTAKGHKCTIVMLEGVALSNSFGEQAGRFFHDQLESHGVDLFGGEELEAFEGDGRVRAVVTKSGRQIPCDAVVVGAGVEARRHAGRARRPGGRERDHLRLHASDLGRRHYAAGDVCSYDSVVHGAGCGSSTGTCPSSRARRRRPACSARLRL